MLGEPILVSEKETAKFLGVKPKYLRAECAAGRLEYVQIAGRRMFSRSGIKTFLWKHTVEPLPSAVTALPSSRMRIQAETMRVDELDPNSDEDWSKIQKCLDAFWKRCKKDDREVAHLTDGKALECLNPVIRNLIWVNPKSSRSKSSCSNGPTDFKYHFVGHNVSNGNGREFHGERVLEKARENASKFGRAGFQSDLYMLLVESLATGIRQGFRGIMINARSQVCDVRLSTVPICNNLDGVTDIIVGATIRPVAYVLSAPG